MNLFLENHQRLIQNLLKAKVRFIIIGGYSVVFHGYRRVTGDVDIWVYPDNENKNKLLSALTNTTNSGKLAKEFEALDFTKHLTISFWETPEKVDILTYINLVTFEEAEQKLIWADIDGIKIPFLHLSHLILSKINTGRAQDKADIEALQRIQSQGNDII
jgi:predicted nucleotidyltransferase